MFNTINPISLPTSSGKCDNNMAFQLKDSTGHTNVQNLFLSRPASKTTHSAD